MRRVRGKAVQPVINLMQSVVRRAPILRRRDRNPGAQGGRVQRPDQGQLVGVDEPPTWSTQGELVFGVVIF